MKAQDYKKLAAEKSDKIIHDVELPSGAVWKLIEPPVQQFIMAGKLPAALTAKLAAVAKRNNGVTGSDLLKELSEEDLLHNLEFGRDLLIHCAVEPRIAIYPKDENEIGPEDILPEDFNFLLNWCFSGGKSGESLSTFREERQ